MFQLADDKLMHKIIPGSVTLISLRFQVSGAKDDVNIKRSKKKRSVKGSATNFALDLWGIKTYAFHLSS